MDEDRRQALTAASLAREQHHRPGRVHRRRQRDPRARRRHRRLSQAPAPILPVHGRDRAADGLRGDARCLRSAGLPGPRPGRGHQQGADAPYRGVPARST
ncbi:hypothetical protein HBB16_17720 [Pseudonocardia sp. MCCB 268]|nr:hypothetical protein [Pseudonocardia cytotoxica]